MKSTIQPSLLSFFFFIFSFVIYSQVALVKDVNSIPENANYPSSFATIGNNLFYASSANGGPSNELRITDGTDLNSRLVLTLGYSKIDHFFNWNGVIYFEAYIPFSGTDIWKSDGTDAGTVMVKDLPDYNGGETFYGFTELNGQLIFSYNDGVNGAELWKTDGTNTGTSLIKDINPGSGNSNPNEFQLVSNVLVFRANNGASGDELWKTDGTEAGTVLVADIDPGSVSSMPNHLKTVGNKVYFSAFVNAIGYEPWVTDGTSAGTHIVSDFTLSNGSTYPSNFTPAGNVTYFTCGAGVGQIDETTEYVSSFPATDATFLYHYNSVLFISSAHVIRKFDGTTLSTVKEFYHDPFASNEPSSYPSRFSILNNELYFQYHDTLWKTDGTEIGTVQVGDGIFSDVYLDGEHQYGMAVCNGYIFFPGLANKLWRTDGTQAETKMVYSESITNGWSMFPGNNSVNGPYNANLETSFLVYDNDLYFQATDGIAGLELWKSDGTYTGTNLLKDIRSEPTAFQYESHSYPSHFTEFGNNIVFMAYPEQYQYALYKTDGTTGGTTLIKDSLTNIDTIAVANNIIFFTTDTDLANELWKSDGTDAGTELLMDINPNNSGSFDDASSYAKQFFPFNNEIYFVANDGTNGRELWKSDGTTAGTVLVKDISPGTMGSDISDFTEVNGALYFIANDGVGGREIWKTDGTTAGTVMVINLNAYSAVYGPRNLAKFGNGLVFTSEIETLPGSVTYPFFLNTITSDTVRLTAEGYYEDPVFGDYKFYELNAELYFTHGGRLWKSDGTLLGTSPLTNSDPNQFYGVNGIIGHLGNEVYFQSSYTNSSGVYSLCKTDGTICGTKLALSLDSVNPSLSLVRKLNNNTFIFVAETYAKGIELYKYTAEEWEPQETYINVYSDPSAANTCNGTLHVELSGNNPIPQNNNFGLLLIDNNSYGTFQGQVTLSGFCPGIYEVAIQNACSDSTFFYVVPVDTNYYVHIPYADSIAVDTLGYIIANCDFDYTTIYSAYIESAQVVNDTAIVVWLVLDANGTHQDTAYYALNSGTGVYAFQLTAYCPTKSEEEYFGALDMLYFDEGVLSVSEFQSQGQEIVLYPNPTNDFVTISFDGTNAHYTLHDAQGKLIQTSSIQSGETVSLRNLQSGVYFFELSTENGKTVKRVVKN